VFKALGAFMTFAVHSFLQLFIKYISKWLAWVKKNDIENEIYTPGWHFNKIRMTTCRLLKMEILHIESLNENQKQSMSVFM